METLTDKNRKLLERLFYSPDEPTAFSSIGPLVKASKLPYKVVRTFLSQQDVWTKHKQHRVHFPRLRIRQGRLCETAFIDLADMQAVKNDNSGYAYFLVAWDTYSRRIWTAPVKSKSVEDMIPVLKQLLEDWPISTIVADEGELRYKIVYLAIAGKEFTSKAAKDLFRKRPVNLYHTLSGLKASGAERFENRERGKSH